MALDPSGYKVEVSSDKMEASLELLNEQATAELTAGMLRGVLSAQGVTHGVNEDALRRIAERPLVNAPYAVAKGVAAEDGRPEEVEYQFDTSGPILPADSESGSVDFRSIKNFNNTRAGTVIAVKKPATAGRAGYDVVGNEYKPREGKRITLRVGKGAALSEDGMTATAEVDGHACLVGDRISVLSTVDIPANVDYSVGNINFIGSVRIRGGIMPGFSVVAEGNVEITGNVEKATIRCGGNLDLRGIVFGQGNCELEVGGDAAIGAIDQAAVSVRGNLRVVSYIRHCKVAVGGKIELTGKKGTIVGGEVAAFRGIQAPFVGNNMATLTKLTVGSNPFVSGELDGARARLTALENKLVQVNTAISAIHERRVGSGGPEGASTAILDKLRKAKEQIEPELDVLNEQVAGLQQQATEYKEAKIRVGELVYPGVVINFRDRLQYKTMDEAQHLSFYEEAAEIRTGPY